MKPSFYSDYERNQLARYQILAQRREYQDRLFWSRVQTLHWIQGGIIGGSLYLRFTLLLNSLFSVITMAIGIILTCCILILCIYDWNDAEVNRAKMDTLEESLGIRWKAKRRFGIFSGHTIFKNIFVLFLLVDLGLLLYFIFDC